MPPVCFVNDAPGPYPPKLGPGLRRSDECNGLRDEYSVVPRERGDPASSNVAKSLDPRFRGDDVQALRFRGDDVKRYTRLALRLLQRLLDRALEIRPPPFLPRRFRRLGAELGPSAPEVTIEQHIPEADPRVVDAERVQLRLRRSAQPQRPRSERHAGGGHRYALNFESGLGPIAELDRQLERTAVARSGHGTVAADQRTIRKKMMREMRRAQIVLALRIGERFTRHRLDDLELAERDQHLHEPDSRATDERPLADRLGNAQTLFHALARRIVVAGIEVAPAELEQRQSDLALAAGFAPDGHRVVDR